MTVPVHPAAPRQLAPFITAPGDTDVLMVTMGIVLLVIVLLAGNFFLWLHSLPERMAHKSRKLQFEVVAVLSLLALFTQVHLFWVAALLLAFIDLPEFGKPLDRIAGSLETIADSSAKERSIEAPAEATASKSVVHHPPTEAATDMAEKPALAAAGTRS